MVATTTHPAQDQKSAVLLARYCWKRCDRVLILLHGNLSGLVCLALKRTYIRSSPTLAVVLQALSRAVDPSRTSNAKDLMASR